MLHRSEIHEFSSLKLFYFKFTSRTNYQKKSFKAREEFYHPIYIVS